MDLRNGDEFAFWTRTADNDFPDRLELRISTSGASGDVGTDAESRRVDVGCTAGR